MTVSLDLQNVKLRQMRSKLFLMSYQQKWVRRFHVCLVLHKKYENYMCKSIVYIQEEGRGVVYTDFYLFFFFVLLIIFLKMQSLKKDGMKGKEN